MRAPWPVLAGLLACCAWTSAIAQRPTASASTLEARVDSLFTRAVRPDGPGCAVGVYRDGEVILARGYGLASVENRQPITTGTTFNLGSLSKPFTATAALLLEQQGRLPFDADVRRWAPELPDYGTPIRVRDLLQHTSGLRDFQALETLSGRPVSTMADFLALLAAQRSLNFTPGTQHEYSHSDFLLLGLIVERIVGVPFGEYLERGVLGPMGIQGPRVHDARGIALRERAFGHVVTPAGTRVRYPHTQTIGGENLYLSVADLARWDRHFGQPAVGGPALLARMLSRPLLANGDTIPYAWGLRLGTHRGLRTISRGGHADGSRSEVIRFPDQRFTVATLCNAAHLEPWRFAQGVADIYLGAFMRPTRPPPEVPAAVAATAAQLARHAGSYRSQEDPWSVVRIELRDGALGELVFDATNDDTLFAMTPAGNGRFFMIGTTGNVGTYTFTPPAAPRRLEISWSDGVGEVLERIPDSAAWQPSSATLAGYAGTWFSEDLDASWRIEVRGQRLALRRRGQSDLSLLPVERDRFVRGFGSWEATLPAHLQFHRDATGRLTHLVISTPPGEESVRDLRFVRLGTP